MKTFIIIIMLCHLDAYRQENCLPLTPNPQVYYKTKEACEKASVLKREEIHKAAKENNLIVTNTYSTCIQENDSSI